MTVIRLSQHVSTENNESLDKGCFLFVFFIAHQQRSRMVCTENLLSSVLQSDGRLRQAETNSFFSQPELSFRSNV